MNWNKILLLVGLITYTASSQSSAILINAKSQAKVSIKEDRDGGMRPEVVSAEDLAGYMY